MVPVTYFAARDATAAASPLTLFAKTERTTGGHMGGVGGQTSCRVSASGGGLLASCRRCLLINKVENINSASMLYSWKIKTVLTIRNINGVGRVVLMSYQYSIKQ